MNILLYFSGLQDASGLSQEFLRSSKVSSLNPPCWWHDPGQPVPWGTIAGGASLMSAGRESLMQKKAGEVLPSPYRKLDLGN